MDRRIDAPEQRICEDVPKLCSGLADLTRECLTAVGARDMHACVPDDRGCLQCTSNLHALARNKNNLLLLVHCFVAGAGPRHVLQWTPPSSLPAFATAAVDAAFYAYQLRAYSGSHAYTFAILGYVFGAGAAMTVAAPNFGGLFKKQQALEGGWVGG